MTSQPMRALAFVLALAGAPSACVIDGSLGSHAEPISSEPTRPRADGGDASAPRPGDEAPASEPAAPPPQDAPASEPAPPDEPIESTPDAASSAEPPHEPADAGEDPPASSDAATEHDAASVVEPPPGCDATTDNPCRVCDQDSCCEARRACLEVEACACHLECYYAEQPETCRESCSEAGEHHAAWLSCLAEHCAELCTL